MSKARINMLSKSELEQLHAASLRILERSGALVRSSLALDLLKKAGAKVLEKEMRVYFPESLVREAIKNAAREFVLGARNPKHDLRIPSGGFPFLCTDGFPVAIRDSDTLEKRPTTRRDLEKWATLADAVSTVDFLWPSTTPTDLPTHLQLIGGLKTSYENTEKHVQYQAFSGEEARLEIEMAIAIAGGEDENRKRPHFSSVQCIVAPLQYDEGSTDAVVEFARAGIPVVAMTMVTPGMTGPVTLAGTVALANAEVLASLTISNVATKGPRVLYCFVCAPLDMKSGSFASGSPEYGILELAGSELAKFYGLPSMMSGYGSSAKSPSVQVGLEKAATTVPVALSGCDLLTGIGGLNDAAFVSMEELLIDAEIWEDVKRTWQGMEVNDSEIAMKIIEKVGPRGQYLNHPHTFANFRRLHISKYGDRSSYAAWEASGKKDMVATVQAEVKRILASHRAAPLESKVKQKLEDIEKRAARALV